MNDPLRVLIVDDEPLALERLRFAFRDIPDAVLVGEASDGVEAAARVRELAPDLVILDIQMPGRTGLSVAQELRDNERTAVVFVTAFEHFAPDAFDVEAVDYLIKPVRLDRLARAIERVRRRRARPPAVEAPAARAVEAEESILVPDRRGDYRVALSMIDWIEAAKDYVLLHTATRGHMVRATMAELEDRLDPAVMIRVHRSAFARRDAIRSVARNDRGAMMLTLTDGTELAVGPSYVRTVDQQLRRA